MGGALFWGVLGGEPQQEGYVWRVGGLEKVYFDVFFLKSGALFCLLVFVVCLKRFLTFF